MKQTGFVLTLSALLAACSADTPAPTSVSETAPAPSELVEASVSTPATAEDLIGSWQPMRIYGEGYEVIDIRDGEIDYESTDARQAGWRVSKVVDGSIELEMTRGPGLSAVDFPNGQRPLYAIMNGNGLRGEMDGDRLYLASESGALLLDRHPALGFVLSEGRSWALVETPDDMAETHPYEFARARLTFNDYSVGTTAGCNGGGASFVQDETEFRRGPLIMTQMACQNDGDDIAEWMVREGPAFQREGDRLWRDFPEGRVVFEARASIDP